MSCYLIYELDFSCVWNAGGCPGSSDIRLETEGSNESCSDNDSDDIQESTANSSDRYAPRQALRRAVAVWHAEVLSTTAPTGTLLQKPPIGILGTTDPVMSAPQQIPVVCNGLTNPVDPMAILEVADDYIQPVPSVSITCSLLKQPEADLTSSATSSSVDVEPMDCIVTPGSTPVSVDSVRTSVVDPNLVGNSDDIDGDDSVVSCDLPMPLSETMQIDNEALNNGLTIDDLTTIIDMFYLPFEYGPRAAKLLSDLFWIKMHAAESIGTGIYNSNDQLFGIDCDDYQLNDNHQEERGVQAESWRDRARNFQLRIRHICETINRVIEIPNRALAYELFPYLWDIKAILFQLDNFVQWLGKTVV